MTVSLDNINSSVVERFKALAKNGRLAHAYLFAGPRDVGKSETAWAVAKILNCEGDRPEACNTCSSCIKINARQHPDIHFIAIQEEKETIKIEQIRGLIERIQLRPFEAKKKVFIIQEVENLTQEAANALLKTLEEPSPNSILILTTTSLEKTIDTIKSRCHHIYFAPLGHAKLADMLAKDYAIEEQNSRFLSRFSEGCLGRARKMNESGLFEQKNEIIDQVILSLDSENYLKTVAADKEETARLLEVLFSWFRDLALLKAGVEQSQLMHQDRLAELRRLEAQYSFEDLKEVLEEIVKARRMLADNLNIKIPLTLIKERLWRRS